MKFILRKLPIYGVCIQTHKVTRYEDPEDFFRELDMKKARKENRQNEVGGSHLLEIQEDAPISAS